MNASEIVLTVNAIYDFNPVYADLYLNSITVVAFLNLPAHFLLLYMAFFHTPKDMFNYKCTVSNTTIWSILCILWSAFVLRPVPLFPFPLAVAMGNSKLVGSYYSAMFHFEVLMFLSINCLSAMIICFVVLISFVLQSTYTIYVSRSMAVCVSVIFHFVMSFCVMMLLNGVYTPEPRLPEQIASTGLNATVSHLGGVVFGYLPDNKFSICSLIIVLIFLPSIFVFVGLTVYTLHKLHKVFVVDGLSRKSRIRWNTALMLTSRTLNPVIFLLVPLVITCWLVYVNTPCMFGTGLVGVFLWSGHGLVNAIATIIVYQPYKRVVKSIFTRLIKGKADFSVSTTKCKSLAIGAYAQDPTQSKINDSTGTVNRITAVLN